MGSEKGDPDEVEEFTPFRPFTRDSLFNIEKRIAEEHAAKVEHERLRALELARRLEQHSNSSDDDGKDPIAAEEAAADSDEEEEQREEIKPNPKLEAGKKIPPDLEEYFLPEHVGKPLEDIDEFYLNQKVFVVIGKDKTIFRFSATNSFFLISPFNIFRQFALYILVHPLFSLCVILTIIVNCVFMTFTDTPGGDYTDWFSRLVMITIVANCTFMTAKHEENVSQIAEYVFTGIYTIEAVVKMTARGYVIHSFTYLRDPWNWLDFGVITIAYLTMTFESLGNLSALRTFRVLRALKTVAVIPGLKTIVGALLEAVIRLRDVGILTSFVLSIFALIGMQLYSGRLRNKCVRLITEENVTDEYWANWTNNPSNWLPESGPPYTMCGNATTAGQCFENYSCIQNVMDNPNFGYTSFDNFGWALLCAFRLMTQDYWENLYMLVLRAEGLPHSAYFILVILMGSFYLVNLILAIVAMSYEEQQQADKSDAEEAAAAKEHKIQEALEDLIEDMGKTPSVMSHEASDPISPGDTDPDRLSCYSEKHAGDHLEVTDYTKPSYSAPGSPFGNRRRRSRLSIRLAKMLQQQSEREHRQPLVNQLEGINLPYADDSNPVTPNSEDIGIYPNTQSKFNLLNTRKNSIMRGDSRRNSAVSNSSFRHHAPHSPSDKLSRLLDQFEKSKRHHHHHQLQPDDAHDKKFEDSDGSGLDIHKRPKANSRTPSASQVDPKDVLQLRELIDYVESESHRRSVFTGSGYSLEKEPLKDKVYRLLCSWEVPPWFARIQNWSAFIVLDAFMDLFITLCILANTCVMALDQHGLTQTTMDNLESANRVFSYIFAGEAFMKILALGFPVYLKDGWNCFDFFIVVLSFVEMLLEGVKGLSVLRSFRLLRVFKLAKSWPTLNMLISIVARTLGALGNLTFVLGIVVFIFAVMGQQMFAKNYIDKYKSDLPRWNFVDFLHAFMIVFRVLCGEWIDSMWNCMEAAGEMCIPFFLLTYIIGNLVVLNLFLALLISSFGTDNIDTGDDDDNGAPNKLAEAFNRFSRFGNWVKVHIIVLVKRTKERKRPLPIAVDSNGRNGNVADGNVYGMTIDENGHVTPTTKPELNGDMVDGILSEQPTRTPSRASENERKSTYSDSDSSSNSDDNETQSLRKVDADGEPEINEVDLVTAEEPDDCFCAIFKRKCTCCVTVEKTCFGQFWWKWRCLAYRFIQHKYFETFIICMILASSLALAMEDVYLEERVVLKQILEYMDKIFTVVFFLEMILKWFAYGWKYYFTDAWCWLDFVIVAISLVMVLVKFLDVGDAESFKAMRTLRALRPLRAVSRWEGMRVVVNALVKAIPSIFNVMVVCLVFWLIFGIVGVQFLAGKFHRCIDEVTEERVPFSEIKNRSMCESSPYNYTWENAQINFDNVMNAYLALFQVATYKGWIEIIRDSVDSPADATYKGWVEIIGDAVDSQNTIDIQPDNEISTYMYVYFVLFIIFGSFFTLNLFIGVIIDNFNKQKKKAGGSLEMFMTEDQKKYYKAMKRMQAKSPIKAIPRPNAGSLEMFMTEDQKKYYNAMKRMQSKSPQKSIPRPTWFPANYLFDITTCQKFDIVIMIVIMLNMLTMALEHHNQSKEFSDTLYWVNFSFIVIFTGECIMKLTGLRQYYFKIPWNVFDFVVVVLSILGVALGSYLEALPISPTLLRVVRVFRVGRVLRLVKSAKGIRTLLFSLAVSLPALFNIGLLLFLVLFIYAVFGLNFFKDVKIPKGGLDDVFNFRTFSKSIITLFQMCTSAGWDGVLIGLMNEKDCDKGGPNRKNTCGSYPLAVMYLVTYLVISFLVVVNMYIAVILENFSQATEDVQQGLTPEDFDMYYEKWEKYDPEATQYIALDKLSDFVDHLDEPLQLPKPNYFMLVKLDIPIYEGDLCYCRDILDALTKNFLCTTDTGDIPQEDAPDTKKKIEYEVISSTLQRQKEHYAARIIQKAYRNYRATHGSGPGGNDNIDGFTEPTGDIIIEIPTDVYTNEQKAAADEDKNSKDSKQQSNETIEMHSLDNRPGGQANDTETNLEENSNHFVVEVKDLKPDSDVVA